MLALGGLFIFMAIAGVALLAIKLLITLVFLPFRIGFGLVKIVLAVLVGIPILVCGVVFAAAALPVLLVACVLGLIALPVVAAAKILF